MSKPRFCFVFVCQRGPLETKALLLAASLRRFLPSTLGTDLVAALPAPESRRGRPHDATLHTLDEYGVREVAISKRLADDYPIGNKLDCLAVSTRAPTTVFLDSDTLMLRTPDDDELASLEQDLAAVPASLAHASEADWRRIYARCGQALPDTQVRLLQNGDLSRPYFNSGLIASRQAARLAEALTETALRIEGDPRLPLSVRRPWLDQVALPVAAARLGIRIRPLDPAWNHPSWAWPRPVGRLPVLYHYQLPERFLEARRVHAIVRELAWANPRIAEVLGNDPAFRPVLAHGWLLRKVTRRVSRQLRIRTRRAA